MTVLDYLRDNETSIYAPCGGHGTCGKCLVSIDGGEPVRACMTKYKPDMTIKVSDADPADGMSMIEAEDYSPVARTQNSNTGPDGDKIYGIAIDIGTTTIAGAICDISSGEILSSETKLNSNSVYGADVISRIRAGNEGHGKKMRQRLHSDLREIIFNLAKTIKTTDTKGRNSKITIDIIAIAGNTTMIHTLMGYDLAPLGIYPYKFVNTGVIEKKAADILDIKTSDTIDLDNSQIVIFPSISAFVGGDIAAGLYHLILNNESETEEQRLSCYALLDLGTNGEMALVTNGDIYAASSAAGPVLEGSGISCGIGSVKGAIDHVRITEGTGIKPSVSYSVIGSGSILKGMCGSGVIDCASEILKSGFCDKAGTFVNDKPLMVARYPDRTPILFTQEDMRQVQLAKAAIAAGFEMLCSRAGVSCDEIDMLYLSGGLGYSIDAMSAVNIGLVPVALRDRMNAIGNSSLKGALDVCVDHTSEAIAALGGIANKCKVIELAGDSGFERTYLRHINFL